MRLCAANWGGWMGGGLIVAMPGGIEEIIKHAMV